MTVLHQPGFVSKVDKRGLIDELMGYHPIWESRYAPTDAKRPGQTSRLLLRPVYWLGGWQFACHNYYRTHDTQHKVIAAEPFGPTLQRLTLTIQELVRSQAAPGDLPQGWELNTCLINYYGNHLRRGRWTDTARVNNHKDHEPGPVASLSLGAAALFDFNEGGKGAAPVEEHNLKDRSLLVFWGKRHKEALYHRVRNVRAQQDHVFPMEIEDFRLRRVNYTLRYVPKEHIVALKDVPRKDDLQSAVKDLLPRSSHWQTQHRLAWPNPNEGVTYSSSCPS